MQFNSFDFLLFFAVVFPLYCALNFRWQNRMLLAASYVFYGWVEPRFVILMAITTVIDFIIGIRIDDSTDDKVRKKWLTASIVMNLTILGVFKYYDFFVDSAAQALSHFNGVKPEDLAHGYLLRLALPVGISFYTFHEISYTVDVYRKHIKAARSFEDFASFIAFFPQLVAGPIGRASWQMPQFEKPRRMTWQGWCEGALLMLIGFFKKVAVADILAPLADKPFSMPDKCSGLQLLIALYCFSFQIYADFSGYTDIARGLAKIMGFELIENFNQPYFSTSITEFWRRWHISLSTWLRDYLYIPLGGNRGGKFNTYRNLFLTMFLGGLWHGASWNFAVWGALHGIYLAVHKLMLGDREKALKPQAAIRADHTEARPAGYAPPKLPAAHTAPWPVTLLKMAVTFHLVALTWLFFRSRSFGEAWAILTAMFGHFGRVVRNAPFAYDQHTLALGICAAAAMVFLIDLPQYLKRDHCVHLRWPLVLRALFYATLFIWAIMMRGDTVPFIYFRF